MNRLKNILVAVDFSIGSKAALKQAIRIAGWNNAGLRAIHVVRAPSKSDWKSETEIQSDVLASLKKMAQAKLSDWIREAGGKAEISVETGSPTQEIMLQFNALSADLLVAGARIASLSLLASESWAPPFTRTSPIKMLLVRDGAVAPFRKVLACVDFTGSSPTVVEQATRVAEKDKGRIHCLHVYSPPWFRRYPKTGANEGLKAFQKRYTDALHRRLQEYADRHKDFAMSCVLFPCSSYGRGIAQYAEEMEADLILLGGHGYPTLRYSVQGSTTERLLRNLPCSVLTVRSQP